MPGIGDTASIPLGASVLAAADTAFNSTNAGTITVVEGSGNYLRLAGTIQNSGLLTLETGGDNRIVADDSVGVRRRWPAGARCGWRATTADWSPLVLAAAN